MSSGTNQIKMITEIKRIEYWKFLTTEKNQPRPKGKNY